MSEDPALLIRDLRAPMAVVKQYRFLRMLASQAGGLADAAMSLPNATEAFIPTAEYRAFTAAADAIAKTMSRVLSDVRGKRTSFDLIFWDEGQGQHVDLSGEVAHE